MTADADRRKRVADVVAIIGRRVKARVDEIEREVDKLDRTEREIELLGPPEGLYRPLTKDDKKIAKRLGSAIGKLGKTLDRLEKDYTVRRLIFRATFNEGDKFAEWRTQLARWQACFEIFSGCPTSAPVRQI